MGADESANAPHWGEMTELGSAWGIGFLDLTYRALGLWPFRLALAPVIAYFVAFSGGRRRAALQFQARAGIPRPSNWTVAKHFWSFAESLLDKVVAWKGGIQLTDVDFTGREAVQAQLDTGQGLLLIGSHLGNLEVGRVLARSRPGLVVNVLVHTRPAENFNRLLHRLDPSAGVHLVRVTEFGPGQAAWLSERIGRGEVVLIAGDRTPVGSARTLPADFLGASAPFPQGPFVLASVLGCPAFLVFCLKQGRRFRILYEPFALAPQTPRPQRQAALQDAIQRYATRLEQLCLEVPYQWFNFYPFWS